MKLFSRKKRNLNIKFQPTTLFHLSNFDCCKSVNELIIVVVVVVVYVVGSNLKMMKILNLLISNN